MEETTTADQAPFGKNVEDQTKKDDAGSPAEPSVKPIEMEKSAKQPPVRLAPAPAPQAPAALEVASTAEKAREQVSQMIQKNELDPNESSSLQTLFREHEAMKEKVSKLKALLGRSAKAQRETKVELDTATKKLDAATKDNERLNRKIDKLATRPTHMDLLADFETNFDRALLSVGHHQQQHQSGGQDTAGAATEGHTSKQSPRKDRNVFALNDDGGAVVDTLLMQELNDSKQRVEKLEKLNSALVSRAAQFENDLKEAKRSMDDLLNKLSRLELEKRMAVMEADQATKEMEQKSASLAEMQMEIDMVTKSAQKAAVRAAAGEEMIKTVKTDKMQVQLLEEKVKALQEWALASNQSKMLAQERIRLLESQLKRSTNGEGSALDGSTHSYTGDAANSSDRERLVDTKKGSLVVGAAATELRVFALTPDLVRSINPHTERLVLRWTFDLTHADADISFSLLAGSLDAAEAKRNASRALIRGRLVTGGAGGETERAFDMDRACTLVWCNSKSWIKPRTVKYSLEAIVLSD